MCIIIVKPKGVAMPDEQRLENAWMSNPDLSGFMYGGESMTHIHRGYEDAWCLMNDLHKRVPNPTDVNIVFHFRIATSGKIDVTNCHPFPVTSDVKFFDEPHLRAKRGFAHNGVIARTPTSWKKEMKTLSDTALFVRDGLSSVPAGGPSDVFLALVAKETGSKFALLSSKVLAIYGSGWIQEEDGCIYSNSSYLHKPIYTTTNLWGEDWDVVGIKDCATCGRSAYVRKNGEIWCPDCDTYDVKEGGCDKCGSSDHADVEGGHVCLKCGDMYEVSTKKCWVCDAPMFTDEVFCPTCGACNDSWE